MSIPKVIHFCWFGEKEKPELVKKCISSWKKYCPDYEIIEWNEENFNVNSCKYCKEAYELKKYAFVSDYARLKIIYENGGIYLDTDVELICSLNCVLESDVFMGIENGNYVSTGLGFGAIKGHNLIKKNKEIYENMYFYDSEKKIISKNCPFYTTPIVKEEGFHFPIEKKQKINGIALYPDEYFNPYNWKTKKLNITKKTISIHHYSGLWMTGYEKKELYRKERNDNIERIFGKRIRKVFEFCHDTKKLNGGQGFRKALIRHIRGGK